MDEGCGVGGGWMRGMSEGGGWMRGVGWVEVELGWNEGTPRGKR